MHFSRLHLLAAIFAALAAAGRSAMAEPPDGAYVGTIESNVGYGSNGWCAVEHGVSNLLRIGSDRAFVGLVDVNRFNGEHDHLAGQPKFSFTNKRSRKVSFKLVFSDCVVPVEAIYRH